MVAGPYVLTNQLVTGNRFKNIIADNRNQKAKDILTNLLPKRLGEIFSEGYDRPLANMGKEEIDMLVERLTRFTFIPEHGVGYRKAEVTRGGISTRFLSSKTMAVKHIPNVYFIGEVVDVTGELGGYNLHWAWASAVAAAKAINDNICCK
jgi:predicted flavoprotein YhiN